ncbi:MAG: EAL domain-containing protein [Acidobacteria bacterium]|nr:EAL domain-containing protein [Acidobacteriota bacterium]
MRTLRSAPIEKRFTLGVAVSCAIAAGVCLAIGALLQAVGGDLQNTLFAGPRAILLAVVAAALAIIAVLGPLHSLVVRPVQECVLALRMAMTNTQSGFRMPDAEDPETREISDAINSLLGELEDHSAALEDQRAGFEQQVAARTAQLRSANQELQVEIAERRRAEAALRYEALHDSLTGLGNRALLMSSLDALCKKAHKDDKFLFALLFLDLDNFKLINDSLGHSIGDHLLCAVGRRVLESVRLQDKVTRLGGDEFDIILDGMNQPATAEIVGRRILSSLSKPFELHGQEIFISASLGVALSDGRSTPERLLRDADAAMYRSKSVERGGLAVFDQQLHESAVEELQIRNELRRVLERDELVLYYQPIVSLKTGEMTGCEALLRWNRPGQGLVPPARFVPLAEDSGLIVDIGEWALRRVCGQLAEWKNSGLPPVFASVNVSPLQFRQPTFVDTVAECLRTYGLEPSTIHLEVTETLLMENTEVTSRRLRDLRGLGVQVVIDDFGTGYSSLSYLRRWAIDGLKIDRSFVNAARLDPASSEIVAAIVALAKALRVEVVAEGVEFPDQLQRLAEMECELVQGFLLGRPASAETFARTLADSRRNARPAMVP